MLDYKIYLNDNSDRYILFLHCICGNMNIFEKQMKSFKEKYNIILVDLPFHGKSVEYNRELNYKIIVDDIIEILDKNSIKKVSVIGLSLGSIIASYMCYYYKNRVEKVIFASAPNGLSNNILNKLFGIFTKLNKILPFNIYIRLLIFGIIPQKCNKDYRTLFYNNALKINEKNMREWLKMLSIHFENYNKYLSDYLNKSSIKKLYLMSKKDYVFIKRIKKSVIENKHCKLVVLDNKSHMLDIDKDDKFSNICISYLF